MKKYSLFFAVIVMLLFPLQSFAEKIPLYKKFYFNMSQQEIMQIVDVVACDELGAGALCAVADETFYGINFTQGFVMENSKLKKVVLIGEFEINSYMNMLLKLVENHVVIAGESTDGGYFNALAFLDSLESYSNALVEWETISSSSEQLTYYLAGVDSLDFVMEQNISDLPSFYRSAPESTRIIEIIVAQYEELLLLGFSVPIAVMSEIASMPDEEF